MSEVAEPKLEGFARTYLLDRVTECLLGSKDPLKVSEVVAGVQHDGTFPSRLVRAVLETSDHFLAVDRRWMLAAAPLDGHRPMDTLIEQVLQHFGRPLTAEQIAAQLVEGLGRPLEVMLPAVQQVVAGRAKYFTVAGRWGLATWLLDVDKQDEDEILFRNFAFGEEDELKQLQEKFAGFRWDRADLPGSAVRLLSKAGEPVPGKALQLLAWSAGRRAFRAREFYAHLLENEDLVLLSTGAWCGPETLSSISQTLEAFAEQLVEQPAEGEEPEAREALEVTEKEVNEIASLLGDLKSHRISELIEAVFELSPGDRDYNAAFGSIWGAMGADERFAWVGGERWRMAGTVPRTLHKIPDILELPYLPYFVDEDNQPIDVELEEDGFEGDLAEAVKDPRVMIAAQPVPEGSVPAEAPAKVRAVVRYEHRLAGTLPIYGDLRAFFPTEPDTIELTFFQGSRSSTAWLYNTNGLALEMGGLYDRLDLPLCGGAFTLQPRGRGSTTDYAVTYTAGDVDELVALSDERLAQLEAMREDPENVETSTFDLLRKIMEGHKKGAHFVTLFTELNVVRRTHAYLIASILSAYACFTYLRPGLWGYEEKKVEQGIRKQKRKFIKE